MTVWYRYIDELYSTGCNEWGESTGSRVEVRLLEFDVLRYTPKGAWINGWDGERWVGQTRKRYAYPTKAEALESFIARKKRQIKIYTARIATAREALSRAEDLRHATLTENVGKPLYPNTKDRI